MNSVEKREDLELFELINKVRENPSCFIPSLQKMVTNFDGELYKRGGDRPNLRTKEGAKAVEDAINALGKIEGAPPFKWSQDLADAAKDHVMDTGSKGLLQHESSDGRSVKERFAKYGKFISCYGENLSFSCESAEEIVA